MQRRVSNLRTIDELNSWIGIHQAETRTNKLKMTPAAALSLDCGSVYSTPKGVYRIKVDQQLIIGLRRIDTYAEDPPQDTEAVTRLLPWFMWLDHCRAERHIVGAMWTTEINNNVWLSTVYQITSLPWLGNQLHQRHRAYEKSSSTITRQMLSVGQANASDKKKRKSSVFSVKDRTDWW